MTTAIIVLLIIFLLYARIQVFLLKYSLKVYLTAGNKLLQEYRTFEGNSIRARQVLITELLGKPDPISNTTDAYWDCECRENFVHRRGKETVCNKCKATASESPDSPYNYVENLLLTEELPE